MFSGQAVAPAIQAFYHATLRVISVVKQDYPDFLSDFHFNLVNSLPDHCIQLRNIILSACPAHVNQPDPFIKNLKIDKLTEIK
jgi:CCR4-NOT transcription complex subunit 1